MTRPNILYLHSHDTGRYTQPYGFAVATPNVQRLAEQGVLFRQAFCANPTCSASRSSLLTGMYAHSNGMLGLAHRGWAMTDNSRHLANVLRQNGYATALAGFQHEASWKRNEELGYEQVLQVEKGADACARDELVARKAAEFISERAREQNGGESKPFYLSCGFVMTHRLGGGEQPEPDRQVQWHNANASPLGDPRYVRPPLPLPDLPEVRRDFADFAVAVNRLDRCHGIVLDALEQSGLADNTIVLLTTDHGIAYPLMKCNLTDHGIGVMLILRGPGGLSGGAAIDALVSQIDVVPTLCEIAGIETPAWVQGRSLVPLVRGDVERVRDAVFAEVNYHAAYEPQRCVRTERYKLVRRYDGREEPVLPNCDDSVSKTLLVNAGWKDQPRPAEALYDLYFDPHEVNNVIDRPDLAGVRDDLRARLDRWMEETDDPILKGPIPPPTGATLNDPDQYSPSEPTTTVL